MKKYFWKISLIIFIFTGLFSGFIANDIPVLCKDASGYRIPVLEKNKNFVHKKNCKTLINPLIKYSYKSIDVKNAGFVSPFDKQNLSLGQQKHFFGTDQIGRDVLAGMIYGTSIALKIGFLSMALSLIIALIMSVYPSYYGDTLLRKTRVDIIIYFLIITTITYFVLNYELLKALSTIQIIYVIAIGIFLLIIIYYILGLLPALKKTISIPLDSIISWITKIFQSIPGILLVLILISLFSKPSIYNIIIVIGILKWPLIARYIRAEILKIKEERFIESSKTLGLKDSLIIWRHILPHIMTPVFIALSFGFASTILIESTLSFLGIGIPADHVSWGSILSQARQNYSAWWLAIFPGLAIFWIIFVFNEIGNYLESQNN